MGPVSMTTGIACMVLSLMSYVATLVRSRSELLPNSVQRRNFSRASGYMGVILISYPFWIAVNLYKSLFCHGFVAFACMMEGSNGFLNAMMYYRQSYQQLKTHRNDLRVETKTCSNDAPHAVYQDSPNVEFGGVDVVELLNSTLSTVTDQLKSSAESPSLDRPIVDYISQTEGKGLAEDCVASIS